MNEFDYLVIGGGSGGIASANRAAEHGAKVAVIEANDLGGTCVNRGCVPKKVSWYASRVADSIHKYGPGYGFHAGNVEFNYTEFLDARDGYISRSRQGYTNSFEKNGITLIEGCAKFVDDKTLEVEGEKYTAKNILIATGGRPAPINVKGGDLLDSSDDFFNWTDLPESVAVIGAGYIAVELSQVLSNLGVETTLVTRYEKPLRSFDDMVSDILMDAMKVDGPTHIANTSFDEYRRKDGRIECLVDGEVKLTVDRVIAAVGRQANTDNLGIENTSIQLDEVGQVVVNDRHETHAEGVYAIGDVIDRLDLTPVAIRAGRTLSEYLFNNGETSAIDYTNIPTVIFSHPAIGTIGYSEKDAIEKYGKENIKVYTNSFYSMYASAAWHRELNKFKLVCYGPDEVVIGLHGIGEGVDEMIQGFGVAMKMGATKAQFDSVIAIHPTGAEEFVTMR
ncbi:glutathione-disulfide reductase [Aerococcaceae bacterium WGS1372]